MRVEVVPTETVASEMWILSSGETGTLENIARDC